LNNPVRYTDPSGHRIIDPDGYDGTHAGLVDDRDDKLTNAGKKMYKMYGELNSKAGWWNDNQPGGMTVEEFLGLWTLWERGGNPGLQSDLTEAVKNQLWMDDENQLNRPAYCRGRTCMRGLFNFMGEYGGGHNAARYTGNAQPQLVIDEGEYTLADLMAKAGPLGQELSMYDPTRISYNPNVPFGWGNNNEYYKMVENADLGYGGNQIVNKLSPDFVIYTINQWNNWFK
jgi:hypothetical protein